MSKPFLIIGLPRSRTAWWSIAATTPTSVCIHEPLKDCGSFEDLADVWDRADVPFVGVSDSGLAPQLGRILNEIAPRTLLVERSAEDVERSLARYLAGVILDHTALRALLAENEKHLKRWHSHELVKVVRFDALNDAAVVEECLEWLMPNNPHRLNRDLMRMNIQVEQSYALEQMRKPHSRWFERT